MEVFRSPGRSSIPHGFVNGERITGAGVSHLARSPFADICKIGELSGERKITIPGISINNADIPPSNMTK